MENAAKLYFSFPGKDFPGFKNLESLVPDPANGGQV
jgi:hypothetical protein